MDVYDREIYKFLTQKENFNQMLKVLEHADMVARNLIQEFWDLVYDKLLSWSAVSDHGWEIFKPDDYFQTYSQLIITKNLWKLGEESPFYLTWESLSGDIHYGLKFVREKIPSNLVQIEEEIRKIQLEKGNNGNKWGWALLFNEKKYNFNDITMKSLTDIIPEYRDQTAEDMANILINLAEELESNLDKMGEMMSESTKS